MKKTTPTRRELQRLLRPKVIEALEGLSLDNAQGACRVARALVGEALALLECAEVGRDVAVDQLRRALLTHYSTRVTSPFGTPNPGAKA